MKKVVTRQELTRETPGNIFFQVLLYRPTKDSGEGRGDYFRGESGQQLSTGENNRVHEVQQLGGVRAREDQMVSDEFVMGMYCLVTFTTPGLLFGFRKLLLMDSANSRLSKAAEYVRPIEV